MQTVRLFCLPYAGGSSAIYARWRKLFDSSRIELIPVELAGRGSRMAELPYDRMEELVDDVYRTVEGSIRSGPFAFFGYSMGCLIAFELAHRIMERTGFMPVHMCMAARKAPHLPGRADPLHILPPDQFEREIVRLGGTPPELFQNSELSSLFLPVLRADLKVVETYCYRPKNRRLGCDFSVLGGLEDDITCKELSGWEQHTEGACSTTMYEGGHFFLQNCSAAVIQHLDHVIGKSLERWLPSHRAISYQSN